MVEFIVMVGVGLLYLGMCGYSGYRNHPETRLEKLQRQQRKIDARLPYHLTQEFRNTIQLAKDFELPCPVTWDGVVEEARKLIAPPDPMEKFRAECQHTDTETVHEKVYCTRCGAQLNFGAMSARAV